ncbi:COG2361 Uncharacterized conserved protein [Flavobacteriaceae bacterium]
MEHKTAKYLFDIFESIQSIEGYLGTNRDYNEYSKNKLLRRGIERELEIIGEALSSLKKLDNSIEISFYKQIIGLRNQIIHSYDNIDDEIIWGIVIRHLPKLKIEIENLLNK